VEELNFLELEGWDEPDDGCADLATDADVLSPPLEAGRRTWSYLKTKWAGIKSDYTLPLSRWTASGQGDPEANFADYQNAQDSHPRVSLYLFYRLNSLRQGLDPDDLANMDGMVSRLIRPDAICDTGANKRVSMSVDGNKKKKRVSTGGFLDTATEADLARLFTPAESTTTRLNMFMTHFDKLSNDLQVDVNEMITEHAAQLRRDLHSTSSPPDDSDEMWPEERDSRVTSWTEDDQEEAMAEAWDAQNAAEIGDEPGSPGGADGFDAQPLE
jgi:hypothetical protein